MRPRPASRAAFRPRLEPLEDRSVPAVFTVTTAADSGPGSLRQAILDSNASVGVADTIEFLIPGAGVHTIALLSRLDVTDPVTINGYSQPGATANTNTLLSGGSNAVPLIVLDCSSVPNPAPSSGSALSISAGDTTVRGLVFNRYAGGSAVHIFNRGGNRIEGCFFGTTADGTQLVPGQPTPRLFGTWSAAIEIDSLITTPTGDLTNWVGGDTAAARNVIAGSRVGVILRGGPSVTFHDEVVNNLIGTDKTGTVALPNFFGVVVGPRAVGNLIRDNVISGNSVGVSLGAGGAPTGDGAYGTTVFRNRIGTTANGVGPLGNGWAGVVITYDSNDNHIGGEAPGDGNVIAYNGAGLPDAVEFPNATRGAGIWVGTFGAAASGVSNSFLGNSIHSNYGLGIDLGGGYPQGPDGVTLNGTEDNSGPNRFQQYPGQFRVIGSATGTIVSSFVFPESSGVLAGTYRVEFFSNSRPGDFVGLDLHGYGEGEHYLGFVNVTVPVGGSAPFIPPVTLPPAPVGHGYLTATATNLTTGDTSEFSAAVVIIGPQALDAAIDGPLPTDPVTGNPTLRLSLRDQNQADAFMAVFNPASPGYAPLTPPPGATTPIDIRVSLSPGVTLNGASLVIPAGIRVRIDGGAWLGGSPALTLGGGELIVTNATFSNTTDAPTILVTGGHLTLLNNVIHESTGFARSAIEINGGTIDFTGNTLNVNGGGELIRNLGAAPVSAVGNTFTRDGAAVTSNFRVEDLVTHALDAGGGGVVDWGAGAAFVTAASGSVQRGVDAVAAGGTVHVESAALADYVAGTKLVTVAFAGGPTFAQTTGPLAPANRLLTVTGTAGADHITVIPATGGVRAAVHGWPRGTFAPTGRVLIDAGDGNDDVQVAGGIALSAWLYGGGGNDRLGGGAGHDVVVGGAGDDLLVGGGGRDVLIGGTGSDRLVGNADDDILIAGFTAYDAPTPGNQSALWQVTTVWTSGLSYADRVAALQAELLRTAGDATQVTVFDDGAEDVLTGSAGQDWFLFNPDGEGSDRVTDLSAAEFAADLDFIAGLWVG